jgi:hypothetical protein
MRSDITIRLRFVESRRRMPAHRHVQRQTCNRRREVFFGEGRAASTVVIPSAPRKSAIVRLTGPINWAICQP